ncbi:MAG: GH39 family glycosyl hydrolase [Nitrososphaerales archaeon]
MSGHRRCNRGRRTICAAIFLAVLGAGDGIAAGASPVSGGTTKISVNAASGGPSIDQNLLGVNQSLQAGVAAMRAIGIRWARTDVSFEATVRNRQVVDCATGSWNSAPLDSRVAVDHAEGATPLLLVDYTPGCLSDSTTDPSRSPPDLGSHRARWDALVEKMAFHEIKAEHVRWFEIWNEPDNPQFWSGTEKQYLNLYVDTTHAIEKAARRARTRVYVGGPALADFLGTVDMPWIKGLLQIAVTDHVPVDFLSWHLYANDPMAGPLQAGASPICINSSPGPNGAPCWYNPAVSASLYSRSVTAVRDELSHYRQLHPLLFIDEWNIDAGNDPRANTAYDAAFAAAVLGAAQSSALYAMDFFDVSDSTDNPEENLGMLTGTQSPKPVYRAFADWHRLTGRALATAVQAPGGAAPGSRGTPWGRRGAGSATVGGVEVGAVGSKRAGIVRILVYDFGAYDPTAVYGAVDPNIFDRNVVVSVRGLAARTYSAQVTAINTKHPGSVVLRTKVSGPATALSLQLAGESVDLVTLTLTLTPN